MYRLPITLPRTMGGVRLTMPQLPHGANVRGEEATGQRRTILPWYCGIADNHCDLEVLEGGTWDDLSKSHRDLTPGPKTPSGLQNMYSKSKVAFPAATQIVGLGPLEGKVRDRVW